ncbi:lytic transglycosylase domain-containing protein [Henriciella marina]|uniref:lytic transglycosylase domain-containing protein n=1 Tax=Henriciella marina TaxID=453851 RepID=UPI000477E781|nr:lytic transglycosylase domain-containing protein [Henriciella marina]
MASAAPIAVAAIPTTPSLKPELVPASGVVPTAEARIFRDAVTAINRGDWSEVRALQARSRDETVRDLIAWFRARSDQNMSFDEMSTLLRERPDWPFMTTLQVRAEDNIDLSALNDQQKIAWFSERGGPASGDGRVALAESYRRTGEPQKAIELIREAWHGNTLDSEATRTVISQYGSQLTQQDHQMRADFLLWTNQRTAATNMKQYVGSDWAKLIDARYRLQARAAGVDAAVDAVPSSLQNHPGLVFDRANWRKRAGQGRDNWVPLLAQIDGTAVPAAGQDDLWNLRHWPIRQALQDRDFQLAYNMASRHGMSSGGNFAEAAWVAGWTALRHLNQPALAMPHFKALEAGTSTPISQARALYWQGRTYEAMGNTADAQASYERAAQYPYVYYGQLAAEKVGKTRIYLKTESDVTEAERTAFMSRPQVKAAILLAENGQAMDFRRFTYNIDDMLETEADYVLLSEVANNYLYPEVGVRGAKAGLAKDVVAPQAVFPIPNYELQREPNVERAMIYALARQESEMNPSAVSHANARGLMQFIPSTARAEAQRLRLPFRTSWLTDDPGYNMTLGGSHLDTLLGQFNGSYIMTAAAYNAGASRPRRWMQEFGDPRTGTIDPIDWVEFIPFAETRNYVQRVLENTQVYRQRIAGEAVDIRLSEDLNRGRY